MFSALGSLLEREALLSPDERKIKENPDGKSIWRAGVPNILPPRRFTAY